MERILGRWRRRVLGGALLVVLFFSLEPSVAAQPAPRHDATPPVAGQAALDYAFKFASAIRSDAKDRGQAQASVVLDLAGIEALDAAVAHAESIDGFRRGTTYADLATHLARAGRIDEARALVAKAEAVRRKTGGWESLRIEAHVAQALAALGDLERSAQVAADVASKDAQQYAGRAAATEAEARAVRGEFDGAMARLAQVGPDPDAEGAWWRTTGYVDVARASAISPEQRGLALEAARKSAEDIEGWQRAEALVQIAAGYSAAGASDRARDVLTAADALVEPLPETMTVKAPLLASLARAWADAGKSEHGRKLLRNAAAVVPHAMEIERPALLASVAAATAAIGEAAEAERLFDAAFAAAEALRNARPRALAVVAIGRSMGRQGLEVDERRRARFDALLAGLGEPW